MPKVNNQTVNLQNVRPIPQPIYIQPQVASGYPHNVYINSQQNSRTYVPAPQLLQQF